MENGKSLAICHFPFAISDQAEFFQRPARTLGGTRRAVKRRTVAQRIASRRRGALAVPSDSQRLVRLDSDRHTALVESATPLVPGMRKGIQAGVSRVYGPGFAAMFGENPALRGADRRSLWSTAR
jgi:hypothetical protein